MKKFRVWCKNNKQWEKDECFLSQDGKLYQLNKYLQTCSLENHIVTFETGLKDKNGKGKDIYEGDIDSHGRYIKSQDGCFQVVQSNEQTFDYLSHMKHIEIIGNIYQNPELLESVQK